MFPPFGPVVQLVRTLACHARGRRFEPVPGRQFFASVAQSVEQGTENPRVIGSIPIGGTILCGRSSSGRAPPCQGGGSEFEPRHPLQLKRLHYLKPFAIWHHSQVVRQRSATPLSPVQIRVAPLRKPWKDKFPGLIFIIKMYLLKTVKTDFWKIGQHQEFFSVSRIRLRL